MTSEEIEIEIQPNGRITYKIKGVKGSACESISELLERIGEVEHEEKTSEYYDLEGDANVSISQQ
jgi:hypothetical protein